MRHLSVVALRWHFIANEPCMDLIDTADRGYVDDATARILVEDFEHCCFLFLAIHRARDFQIKILAFDACLNDFGVFDTQSLENICDEIRRSGGGESENGRFSEMFNRRS